MNLYVHVGHLTVIIFTIDLVSSFGLLSNISPLSFLWNKPKPQPRPLTPPVAPRPAVPVCINRLPQAATGGLPQGRRRRGLLVDGTERSHLSLSQLPHIR